MDQILWQNIPVSRVATLTTVACRLLAVYLVGHGVALRRATHSLDKSLKFIAAHDDASIADVCADGSRHWLRLGAWNA
jgi:hypothetical protein